MSKVEQKSLDQLLDLALVPKEEQPYDLPLNWEWVKLGKVVTINPKKTKMNDVLDEQNCSFVPMSAVSDISGEIEEMEERLFSKVRKGYTQFFEGDILFAKITPCMENGKAAIAKNLKNSFGYGSTEFYVLRPSEVVDKEFIFFLIRSNIFRLNAKANMTGAVGQQRVPKTYLENYPLPLPPLKEQKKIVNKVKNLLNKIEQSKQLIEEAKVKNELYQYTLIDKYLNSVEDRKYLTEYKLADIADFENGDRSKAYPKTKELVDEGIPFISTQNLTSKVINLEQDIKHISKEKFQSLRSGKLKENDIVMCIRGSVGKSSVFKGDNDCNTGFINAQLVIIRSGSKVIPEYLYYNFQSAKFKNTLKEISTGSAQPQLSVKELGKVLLEIPPIDIQKAVVEKLNTLLSKVHQQFELQKLSLEQLNKVEHSIIEKAFKCQLGTNNPEEENAKGILREILKEK